MSRDIYVFTTTMIMSFVSFGTIFLNLLLIFMLSHNIILGVMRLPIKYINVFAMSSTSTFTYSFHLHIVMHTNIIYVLSMYVVWHVYTISGDVRAPQMATTPPKFVTCYDDFQRPISLQVLPYSFMLTYSLSALGVIIIYKR